jgi:ATP-binding cassette, subfamily B, heavy metal transporter
MSVKKKEKINLKDTLIEIIDLGKKYKWSFFLILTFSVLFQFASLADKFIFKEVISGAEQYLERSISQDDFVNILLWMFSIYIVIIVFSFVFIWFQFHILNKFESKVMFDIKEKYFNHIVELDYIFHSDHKTGSLISKLSRGVGAVENFFDTILFSFAPLIIQVIIIIPSFFKIGLYQAVVFLFFILFYIIYSLIFIKKAEVDCKEANKAQDLEKANVSDVFTNIESIKYFGKENLIKNNFQNLIDDTRNKKIKEWNWWRYSVTGQRVIFTTAFLLLFYISFRQFIAGENSLAEITFTYTIFLSIMGPINWFSHGIRNISRSTVDLQDLFEYKKYQNNIKDKKSAFTKKITSGDIEFKNIFFKYPGTKKYLFDNFNLKIKAGEKVALVGESGSGKTTLVKLLYRFYNLNKGQILIDSKNLADFKQEFIRSEMSIVPQEAILFDDTVFNNIKFSNPEATAEQVWDALEKSQLKKFVEELPKKELTIVGERGIKLSGGQKQRVSIARAILADKKILVLDEATSALDSQTEHHIQANFHELMENRTTIVVAHRLSTVMQADKIVVLKDGKIIQTGKHLELINQEGEYKKLWSLQKDGFLTE